MQKRPLPRPTRLHLEQLEDRCLLDATSFALGGETPPHPPGVEPKPELAWIPKDSLFSQQWDLRNTGQGGGTVNADVDADLAWNTINTTRVTTGVIDSGIDYRHPDLYLNVWLNQGEIPASRLANLRDYNGDRLITFRDLNDTRNQGVGKISDQDGDRIITAADVLRPMTKDAAGKDTGKGGWADGVSNSDKDKWVDDLVGWNFAANNNKPLDDAGHGSHVSGTIGAIGNNGTGVAGIAWNTQVMALKSFDANRNGTVAWIADATDYAVAKGAKLINGSWTLTAPSSTLSEAIARAQARGVVLVVAAGNYAKDADLGSYYPVKYTYDNLVAVAATDNKDNLASFSNWGKVSVDIAAPGVNVLSTNTSKSYGNRTGTSMAAPHVTGALALVWALRPEWNYKTVIAQVLNSADRLTSLSGKVKSGRLDVANAIKVPPRGSTLPTLSEASLQEVGGAGGGQISLAEASVGALPSGGIGGAFVERVLPIRFQAVSGSEVLLPVWMTDRTQVTVWNSFESPIEGPPSTTPTSFASIVSSAAQAPPRWHDVGSAWAEDEAPDTSALDELFSGPMDDIGGTMKDE